MNWDKLRVFHAVAEAGSFTRAGDILHLSQSAVSRQVASLEESLSVVLFHRHSRGLILTEQGETLFSTTQNVEIPRPCRVPAPRVSGFLAGLHQSNKSGSGFFASGL